MRHPTATDVVRQRFPSRAELRAVELGPAELMNLLEWKLRKRPRALRHARRRYCQFCVALYRNLERNAELAVSPSRVS
jgi:hypothetical protein